MYVKTPKSITLRVYLRLNYLTLKKTCGVASKTLPLWIPHHLLKTLNVSIQNCGKSGANVVKN